MEAPKRNPMSNPRRQHRMMSYCHLSTRFTTPYCEKRTVRVLSLPITHF